MVRIIKPTYLNGINSFLFPLWEKLDDSGFSIFFGYAWVEVRVYPWGNNSIINTCSTMVIGAELKPDLLEFLLRSNAKIQFGSFSLDS